MRYEHLYVRSVGLGAKRTRIASTFYKFCFKDTNPALNGLFENEIIFILCMTFSSFSFYDINCYIYCGYKGKEIVGASDIIYLKLEAFIKSLRQ
jgi:hypothetical protein